VKKDVSSALKYQDNLGREISYLQQLNYNNEVF
jgi:hypothetical protein